MSEKTRTPLAARLAGLMLQRRMTQAELAREAGLSQSLVSKLLSGDTGRLRSSTTAKLARLLQTDPETICLLQDPTTSTIADRPNVDRRRAAGSTINQIITSQDLDGLFAPTRRDAQELLPHLVRRLVLASCEDNELPRFTMPAGDDVRLRGWDGTLTFSGVHPFVPSGESVWEMGVSSDAASKANADYAKRTAEPLAADPEQTTFVFVTPRIWMGKDKWIAAKKDKGDWNDVRVIDASDIALWLDRLPAVALWIADALGRPIRGIESLEHYWRACVSKYSPRISPDLVVGGRTKSVDAIARWLQSPSETITLVGETAEEAALFAAAVFRQSDPDFQATRGTSRLIFVSDDTCTEHLGSVSQEHLLVITDPALVATLRPRISTHVRYLIAEQRDSRVNSTAEAIDLGPVSRNDVEKALKDAGFSKDDAARFAMESKGSLHALMWMVAKPDRGALDWGSGTAALELAPLVLAGQWMIEDHPDHDVVSELAQRPYSEIRQTIARWSGPGKPLGQRGALWDWKAWQFAWSRLAPSLTQTDIDRFLKVANEILGTPDPALELAPADRWLANIRGKVHKYSSALRKGLIESVVLLAINGDSIPGGDGQVKANLFVRSLLRSDDQATRWLSIAPWLPDLAEAAPDEFLDALESFIGDEEAISALFAEGGMFGSSPHIYLLWACDRLAWSPDHLGRVVLALGALADVDPGGQLANRPPRSLRMIFLPWYSSTLANVDTRLVALRLLFDNFEDVAWQCAASLLPSDHDIGDPITRPQWRPWADDRNSRVSMHDYWRFIEALVDSMIEFAGANGRRWSDLCNAVPILIRKHSDLADRVLTAVETLDAPLDHDDAFILGETVRQLVMHHENMHESDWALKGDDLERLKSIRDRRLPQTPRDRHRWLFTQWPEVLREYDLSMDEREEKLGTLRTESVCEVFAAGGLDELYQWSADVDYPPALGASVAAAGVVKDECAFLEHTLRDVGTGRDRPPLAQLAFGYIGQQVVSEDDGWIDAALQHIGTTLEVDSLAYFFQALPRQTATWDLLATHDAAVCKQYWAEVRINVLDLSGSELAIRQLLDAKRLYAAVDLLGMLLHRDRRDDTDEADGDRIETLVRQIFDASLDHLPRDESPPVHSSMISHHLDAAFRWIEARGTAQSDLAAWEWKWLPFIEDSERGLRALQRELSCDPALFVELLTCVYRAHSQQADELPELNDAGRARAHLAYKLLEAWKQVPGLSAEAHPMPQNGVDEGMNPITPAFVGQVDEAALSGWIADARRLAAEADRVDVCDHTIGRQFAYAPSAPDGSWPCTPVCNSIEKLRSEELERGLVIGVMNRRGVHAAGRDGEQERRIAAAFRVWSERLTLTHPRTGSMLRRLAESYEREAAKEVERGQLDEYGV